MSSFLFKVMYWFYKRAQGLHPDAFRARHNEEKRDTFLQLAEDNFQKYGKFWMIMWLLGELGNQVTSAWELTPVAQTAQEWRNPNWKSRVFLYGPMIAMIVGALLMVIFKPYELLLSDLNLPTDFYDPQANILINMPWPSLLYVVIGFFGLLGFGLARLRIWKPAQMWSWYAIGVTLGFVVTFFLGLFNSSGRVVTELISTHDIGTFFVGIGILFFYARMVKKVKWAFAFMILGMLAFGAIHLDPIDFVAYCSPRLGRPCLGAINDLLVKFIVAYLPFVIAMRTSKWAGMSSMMMAMLAFVIPLHAMASDNVVRLTMGASIDETTNLIFSLLIVIVLFMMSVMVVALISRRNWKLYWVESLVLLVIFVLAQTVEYSAQVNDGSIYTILWNFAPFEPLIISFMLTLIFYKTRPVEPEEPPQVFAQPDLA